MVEADAPRGAGNQPEAMGGVARATGGAAIGTPIPCAIFPFQQPRRIVIIGPMAAGKTTVAAGLAARLGWQALDIDDMVAAAAGKTVAAIFGDQGEQAFRALEADALQQALTREEVVIATGGGIVLSPINRQRLQTEDAVVALAAPPAILAARLTAAGRAERPLLAAGDVAARLTDLWAEREPLYRAATDLWVDVGALDPTAVIDLLVANLGFGDRAAVGPGLAARPSGVGLDADTAAPGPAPAPGPWYRLTVGLAGAAYPVWVGWNVAARLGSLLTDLRRPRRALVVTDEHVEPLLGPTVAAALTDADISVERLVIPAGEEHKTIAQMSRIHDAAVAAGLDRRDIFVAVGGGVVGDMTGFAAATYLRGVDWVQVPTTLLAQVDASVGGKTGVNHPRGKNLIGAFHQPLLVLADTAALTSLPLGEWRSGLAEVVKHGFLSGGAYSAFINAHAPALRTGPTALPPHLLAALVAGSVAIKAAVVAADEREQGVRALLNLGHTVGHALEATAGYGQLRHGEAVAIGMVAAAHLSRRLGLMAPAQCQALEEQVAAIGLPTRLPPAFGSPAGTAIDDIMAATAADKKRRQDRLRWVLPIATAGQLGGAMIRDDVPPGLVQAVLIDLQPRS